MKGVSVLSKERLTNETLNNAISTYKTVVEVAGDIDDEDYSPILDKVTLSFLQELKQYRDLDEQGLLLRLPCERVWFICDKGTKYATVMSKSIYDLELYQIKEIDVKGHYFSTQSEAEEKLRELEGRIARFAMQ